MPFYNNVYYPYSSDTQGSGSSLGIPSLLSSPQSNLSSGNQFGRPVMSGPSAFLSFKFRPRLERVDWRRINAVDVERLACELDFQTLQEHVSEVTFCNVEDERCPRCRSPVDPALLKLFRLAQLTVEYLLHSQDCLTASLQAAEERLQGAAREREALLAGQQKLKEEAKALKEELKQRKKIISSQQAVITAGMTNYHKCQHCEKAFINSSFLQSHTQRRHPDNRHDYEIKLTTENDKKAQYMKFQEEINKLKEQLSLTKCQLDLQQQAFLTKPPQEKDRSKEEDLIKKLEKWKDEESAKMNKKLEETRDICLRDMEALFNRNTLLQKQLAAVELSNRELMSNLENLRREKTRSADEDKYHQEVLKLQHHLRKREDKWESRMLKIQQEYEREKKELLLNVQTTLSSSNEEDEFLRRCETAINKKLEEQKQLITSQREQIHSFTSGIVAKEKQSPAPEPKPRQTMYEQNPSVHKLDPIEELSEEDKDSGSFSDKPNEVKKPRVPRSCPNVDTDLRAVLELALEEKLESIGVKSGTSRLPKSTYKDIMAGVHLKRERVAKEIPEYRRIQDDLSHMLGLKMKQRKEEILELRPLSTSLPPPMTLPASRPPPVHPRSSQPAPRILPKASTPKTPPFSSDEDEDDDESKSLSKESPRRLAPPPVISPGRLPPTPVVTVETDSDWTEGSELEEINVRQLLICKEQRGDAEKSSRGETIQKAASSQEKQPSTRGQKPVGGANPTPEEGEVVRKLTFTKVDEDDEDDWDISSLEDIPSLHNSMKGFVPVRKSVESAVTSVWSTSTGNRQKTGLTEAGKGSTQKNHLISVSDWSDSDDI